MTTNLNGGPSSSDERSLLVHAYLDGELDPYNALAVDQRIASDPALGAEVERIQALRKVVRERLPREELPPHLLTKINKAIGQSQGPAQPTWRALAASVALAAVLGAGSTWLAFHSPAGGQFSDALIDSHMRALIAPQPVDVVSSERHTVKPWFNGRIAQSPQVVDLSKDGFPLVGGRVDVAETVPVATLVYGRRLHLISLTAKPTEAASSAPVVSHSTRGYNVVVWSENGVTYSAVSDLNTAELLTFARLFQTSLPGRA